MCSMVPHFLASQFQSQDLNNLLAPRLQSICDRHPKTLTSSGRPHPFTKTTLGCYILPFDNFCTSDCGCYKYTSFVVSHRQYAGTCANSLSVLTLPNKFSSIKDFNRHSLLVHKHKCHWFDPPIHPTFQPAQDACASNTAVRPASHLTIYMQTPLDYIHRFCPTCLLGTCTLPSRLWNNKYIKDIVYTLTMHPPLIPAKKHRR